MLLACSGVPLEPQVQASLRSGGIAVLEDPELALRALARIRRASGKHLVNAIPELGVQASGELAGLHAAIANDRDFGPVLALSTAGAARRIVRALPASDEDLRDAVSELIAMHPACCEAAERIVRALAELQESTPGGSEARTELTLTS